MIHITISKGRNKVSNSNLWALGFTFTNEDSIHRCIYATSRPYVRNIGNVAR